jgi:hypothetical protein
MKSRAPRSPKKQVSSLCDDLLLAGSIFRASGRDGVKKTKRQTEAIESGTEIRSTRWNADGNLLPHCDFKGRGDCPQSPAGGSVNRRYLFDKTTE